MRRMVVNGAKTKEEEESKKQEEIIVTPVKKRYKGIRATQCIAMYPVVIAKGIYGNYKKYKRTISPS